MLLLLFFYCDCDNNDDCDITCDSYIKFIVSRFNYLWCYFDYFLLFEVVVIVVGLLLLVDIYRICFVVYTGIIGVELSFKEFWGFFVKTPFILFSTWAFNDPKSNNPPALLPTPVETFDPLLNLCPFPSSFFPTILYTSTSVCISISFPSFAPSRNLLPVLLRILYF